jgi:hypothetical protein
MAVRAGSSRFTHTPQGSHFGHQASASTVYLVALLATEPEMNGPATAAPPNQVLTRNSLRKCSAPFRRARAE